jgi:hypothetical protein
MRQKRAVVAVSVWLMAASVGRLADAAEADDLIAQGIKLRQGGRDQEALPLFRQALERQPTPRAFAQVGTCEQALGLWVAAEAHIQEALSHPQDPWIKKNGATLQSALTFLQQRIGSVEVWGDPPGARISIDGEFAATLPMSRPARASVGQRAITIEAPGFATESRTVGVLADSLIREHVALRSLAMAASSPAARPVPTLTSAPPGSPTVSADSPGGSPGATPAEQPPIYRKWWFWTIVGAVAIGAGASIYLLANRNSGCQASMGATCTSF